MDELLNYAPGGFLTLSNEGTILSINQTLLTTLDYRKEQLIGKHINNILSVPARIFYQIYFIPLIKVEQRIEEMYLTLNKKDGKEIPVLLNASGNSTNDTSNIHCIIIPMQKRNELENQLLLAKKEAELALKEKNIMNTQLKSAFKELEEKQKELLELNKQNQKFTVDTKLELQLARKIQKTFLTEPFSHPHVKTEVYYQPAGELSGDMYGVYRINEYQYGIIILDVMGHSISSAFITISLHSLFHRLISTGVTGDVVMKELDHHIHSLFQHNEDARHYCTAIHLLIDTRKKEIEYINAGHPPAIWQEINGRQRELKSTTPPIGLLEGIAFKSEKFSYGIGGKLALYTDGITEPQDCNFLAPLIQENATKSLSEVKERIMEILNNNRNIDKKDDQCLILVDIS
ncbi:SpoIIE family protein phosphatase [Sutcliffiella cohnii]|uniref:Phosphoserine phosphatase n=1 Tax=Sutcliffiella cohnii TaxID=33932 RepID=A0A223KL25_9BACI|nr:MULTISPECIES: SpoIIE family protein phosphatase [Sutcliffiella]AST90195.1 phosphoserine phosphatase [Sutcliffiella cohnii]MED4015661.1 SpoIIE family protein phosphatase [Sutcliffiella cohnii]WBL15847.1 SpoIIE family protein phosphatase [Sutcliffiella sp. NC1]